MDIHHTNEHSSESLHHLLWSPGGPSPSASLHQRQRRRNGFSNTSTVYSMQDPGFGHSSIHPWPAGWELNRVGNVTVVGAKEEDEMIPEEEAVCRFCFHVFAEDDRDVMKTKCKCKFALGHQECANEWWVKKGNTTNCEYCDHNMEFIEVSLVRLRLSSTPQANKGKIKRSSSIGKFLSGCTSCFSM